MQTLHKLVLSLLSDKHGADEAQRVFLKAMGDECERLVLQIGDQNPALSDLLSAEIAKMKEELRKRSS